MNEVKAVETKETISANEILDGVVEDLKTEELICIDCQTEYELTPEHIAWFTSKNMHLPKRCPKCIKRRKEENIKRKSEIIRKREEKSKAKE